MQYVHIKNISQYNPGYTDRAHIWAKIYWKIFIDEEYQLLDEIDRHRFIGLIVFETYAQKPVALTAVNLALMGWNTKKRSISLTLKMLHKFLDVRNENVTQSRVEESRVEESRVDSKPNGQLSDKEFLKTLETNPAYKGIDLDTEFAKMDAWLLAHPGRKKTQRFIVNWLNKVEAPVKTYSNKAKADPHCKLCNGSGSVINEAQNGYITCECVNKDTLCQTR